MIRRTLALLMMLALLALSALPAAAAPPPKEPPKPGGLSSEDTETLAEARARGDQTVTVLIAALPGQAQAAVNSVQALGGTVAYREDAIGYVRARIPTAQAEKTPKLTGVLAVELDRITPLPDPRPEGSSAPTPQTPPSSSTPLNNPYMPIADTGAAQFRQANPAFDGRGVTIGILDSGIDLGHPSLQTTTTGERKIVGWRTLTDPTFTGTKNNDDDPTWIRMTTVATGASVGLPAEGDLRVGTFDERDPRLGGELGSDVNRDGNPGGSSGIFKVAWNPTTNMVWVDTNQNNTFADDPAMTDYAVRFDIGQFGTDNPATPLRESLPFVVQTDSASQAVNIGIVSGQHGTHVAGITAATAMFGATNSATAISGAAPGAKLVSARACLFTTGCTNHALLEGMIYLAKPVNLGGAGTDVINMSIGGLPALNDGNTARTELYDRLISTYNVQMFISAGNDGPGLNTIGDPSVATTVLSVGAYVSRATLQSNYGSDSAYADNLNYFTSRGPREDGGFKPQIIAPGSAISTIPTWQAGGPIAGTFDLPPGYAMLNGTSMASPQAAGAAALLIGAAKQQVGLSYRPDQLRQALISSARYIEPTRIQAFEQGNGLINVGAAWALLKTNIRTAQITSSVPVNTLLSGFLQTPGIGVGIYDREGVTIGQAYTRQYTFTLKTGSGSAATRYNLRWVGNDGTFSAPAGTLNLRPNVPVSVTININPATAGAHAAILNLDDPTTPGIDYQTMNVVVAGERFTAANGYSIAKIGTVGRNQSLRYFFVVPASTTALKVDFSGPSATPGTGQARFLRWHPYGVGIDANASTSCFSPPRGDCATGSPNSRVQANPLPGVWEVTVDAGRTSDAADVPFVLTTSLLGVTIAPNPDVIASATINTPIQRAYTITNSFGAVTGHAAGSTLGSAKQARPTISTTQQQYQIPVTAGSTKLTARIGNPSDPGADLDLFLFNCTSGSCILAAQSTGGSAEEVVTVNNPAAGLWVALVDPYAVPSGSTSFDYLDIFINPAFGTVTVPSAPFTLANGASTTVQATITPQVVPAAGRVLSGTITVVLDPGTTVIGSGEIVIQSVTNP